MRKPTIIIGSPRSGTLLLSRIVGGHPDTCLITEHTAKQKVIPEDCSGVLDDAVWRYCFRFPPDSDVPAHNACSIRHLRNVYGAIAGEKRLVLKNPRNSLRVPILRDMFPDAQFIYLARNPWHVMQSMLITESQGFLLRNGSINELPPDGLLRAAATWAQCVKTYMTYRDETWITVRYEDIVRDRNAIASLLSKLDLADSGYLEIAGSLPRSSSRNFYFLKALYEKSQHKVEIEQLIRPGAELFAYSDSIQELPASMVRHRLKDIRRRLYRTRRAWGIGAA